MGFDEPGEVMLEYWSLLVSAQGDGGAIFSAFRACAGELLRGVISNHQRVRNHVDFDDPKRGAALYHSSTPSHHTI